MTPADLATWLFTYAVHSTVLLAAAWVLTRHRWLGLPAPADALWKAALVGGIVTATVHQAAGPLPWHIRAEIPQYAEPAAATDAALPAETMTANVAVPEQLSASTAPAATGPVSPFAPIPSLGESPAAGALTDGAASATAGPASRRAADLLFGAVVLWAVLAAGALVRLAFAHVRLARWLAPRRPVTDPALLAVAHELARAAGVSSVRLTWSPDLYSPVALGASEICLPSAAFEELDEGQLRSVLAHEIAHLARRDPHWLALSVLLERLFFFQPLNRLARRRMQESAEFLCDEWAAREAGSGITLATSLARVAEWLEPAPPRPLPLAGMAESGSQLLRRVHRLMETDVAAPARGALRSRLAGVTLVLLTGLAIPGVGVAERAAADEPVELDGIASRIELEAPGSAAAAAQAVSQEQEQESEQTQAQEQEQELQREVGQRVERKLEQNAERIANKVAAEIPTRISTQVSTRVSEKLSKSAAKQSMPDTTRAQIIAALVAGLRDSDPEVRRVSADALGNLEDRRAVPGLTAALRDDVLAVRRAAVSALGDIEDPASVEPLIGALGDADASIRREAAGALGNLEDRRATAALLPLLRDPSVEVRREAAEALGDISDPRAADALAAALGDEDPKVRYSAAEALGNLELTAAPPQLLAALRDPVPAVQHAAAEAVGEIGDARAVPALRAMLDSGAPEAQEHAVEALGEIRTQEALEALVAAMRSPNPTVRRHAASALGRD